jgi:hypothetical protein
MPSSRLRFSWGHIIEDSGARCARAASDDYFLTAFDTPAETLSAKDAMDRPCGWEIYLFAAEDDVPADFPGGKIISVPLGGGRSQIAGVRVAAGQANTFELAQKAAEAGVSTLEMHWHGASAFAIRDRIVSLYGENNSAALNITAVRVWSKMNRQTPTLEQVTAFTGIEQEAVLHMIALCDITDPVFSRGRDALELKEISSAILTWVAWKKEKQTVCRCAEVFNTTSDIVRDAVAVNRWGRLTGPAENPAKQFIELVL